MEKNAAHLLSFKAKKRVPVILQTEMAECGLACLAMISSYYGHEFDLTSLRSKFSIPLTGATLKNVMEIADQLSLSSRPIKAELDQLINIKVPAILHWDLNHFVVLERIVRGKAIIVDPAKGRYSVEADEASKHFTGVVLELTPSKTFTKKNERTPVRLSDFWEGITGLKSSILKIFILTIILQLFTLLAPLYVQFVVDDALLSNDTNLLTVLAIGFALLLLCELLVKAFRSSVILMTGASLGIQMADNLFHHLIRLPISYFEKRHIGDVISRFNSLDHLRELITKGFVEAVVDGLMSIVMLVVVFVYSVKLGLVVVTASLIYLLVRILCFFPLKKKTEESIEAKAKEQTNFIESVRGIQAIRNFGKELYRRVLWQNKYADFANKNIQLGAYSIGFEFILGLVFGLENIIIVFLGAKLILEGAFTVGMLYAFLAYQRLFLQSYQTLIEKIIEFMMIRLHLYRLSDIVKTSVESNYYGSPDGLVSDAPQLELRDVSFQFSQGESLLFKKVSFHIKAGETIAIIGSSGTGKTTLLRVMLGLLKPTQGKVLYCGVEIDKLGLKNYRSKVASVMQEDSLFSGSIIDNISFFDADMDRKFAEECAKLACVHDDILNMPMGYNTLVGDMGSTLSGGQKQRLLLARALYQRPKIIMLDEATSHLDIANEAMVNKNLKSMQITRILIAHRPNSIRMADRFFAFYEKELVEISEQEVNQLLG